LSEEQYPASRTISSENISQLRSNLLKQRPRLRHDDVTWGWPPSFQHIYK